jgi:PhnB protein
VTEFYKDAFGAQKRYRMETPAGKRMAHAETKIGDSVFMVSDEMPGQECGSPPSLGGTQRSELRASSWQRRL